MLVKEQGGSKKPFEKIRWKYNINTRQSKQSKDNKYFGHFMVSKFNFLLLTLDTLSEKPYHTTSHLISQQLTCLFCQRSLDPLCFAVPSYLLSIGVAQYFLCGPRNCPMMDIGSSCQALQSVLRTVALLHWQAAGSTQADCGSAWLTNEGGAMERLNCPQHITASYQSPCISSLSKSQSWTVLWF